MSFRKILVPVMGSPSDGAALAAAFAIAKPSHAHVAALFVHPNPNEVSVYVYSGVPVSPALVQGIVDGQKALTLEARTAARATLLAAAKDAGAQLVADVAPSDKVTCSFEAHFGFVPRLIAEASQFADLVVFKPIGAHDRTEISAAINETLTVAGRPVLLAGPQSQRTFAEKIVIAWDGGNAASRAITAALPLLEHASGVEILTIDTSANGNTASLREFLALHGVKAVLRCAKREGRSIGEALLEEAAKSGADLIVMGGYGHHSHLREAILGGVTVEVESRHVLPVFLMH